MTARSFEIFSTFTAVIDILTSELMEEKKKKRKEKLERQSQLFISSVLKTALYYPRYISRVRETY